MTLSLCLINRFITTPEEALNVAQDLKSKKVMGTHWGTFVLSLEPIMEPPIRFKASAEKYGFKKDDAIIFKILGFSKKEIILSSIIEFVLIFFSVILIAIFFAVIGSYYIIENIFQLVWQLDLQILFNISGSIGFVTLALIMLTNLKYLNPKVYPLIRNQ